MLTSEPHMHPPTRMATQRYTYTLNEFVFKAGANVISAYTSRLFLSANQQRESTAGQPAVTGDTGPSPSSRVGRGCVRPAAGSILPLLYSLPLSFIMDLTPPSQKEWRRCPLMMHGSWVIEGQAFGPLAPCSHQKDLASAFSLK